MSRKPDFLCIGAQKSATTWLHVNLKQHPGIWLPPHKELHYFDLPRNRPTIWLRRRSRSFRPQVAQDLRALARRGEISAVGWYLYYLLGLRGERWYLRLFRSAGERIAGEITPTYSVLTADRIRTVHRLLPECKIIFLLRDPVERSWSQVNMQAQRNFSVPITQLPSDRIRALLDHEQVRALSHYSTALGRWTQHFPPEQIFLGYFEAIQEQPQEFLGQLLAFLDLEPPPGGFPTVAQRQMEFDRPEMPDDIRRYLSTQYLSEIQALDAAHHNRYTSAWLDSAQKSMADPFVSSDASVFGAGRGSGWPN